MTDAIKVTLHTEDNLLITASIKKYNGNLFGDFSVEPFFPAIETTEKPKHAFDINNPHDPTFNKIESILTDQLKKDILTLQTEFKKLGIKLVESKTDPLSK